MVPTGGLIPSIFRLQPESWTFGMSGEALGTLPQTYDLLPQPTTCASGTHPDVKDFATVKAAWSKKNTGALGLLQGTILPVIWQDFIAYNKASILWTELENQYGKVGGVTTYFQLVNMIKFQFTNLMDMLPQFQEFQENYTQITLNGYSKLPHNLHVLLQFTQKL